MTKQVINLGASANDGTGDPARSAFTKANANFSEIYQYLGDGSTLNKLGTAAFKNTGTGAGNVMEVGLDGFGSGVTSPPYSNGTPTASARRNGIYANGNTSLIVAKGGVSNAGMVLLAMSNNTGSPKDFFINVVNTSGSNWGPTDCRIYNEANTTVDSNGFIKKASPIIKLFAEKIEPNEEALEQEPIFEKVDVGHYLIKNTEGFSDDGWYIEMPKDANGNVLVAVQYQQSEDNTIEVKTFAKKFDEETGDILPNLEKPRDIPVDRWIDIRLKALPQPEIEISNTPIEFQPTNLAQAVAEALKNDIEQ